MPHFETPLANAGTRSDEAPSAPSITLALYRKMPDGTFRWECESNPALFEATHGLALNISGPAQYYLDQIRTWPAGEMLCVWSDDTRSLYVQIDAVHAVTAALLAWRQATTAAGVGRKGVSAMPARSLLPHLAVAVRDPDG